MKISLMILIGLPASGKTTLAKNLLSNFKHHKRKNYLFIHVCYDDLISPKETNWKESRNLITGKIKNLILSLKEGDLEKCPPEFRNQIIDSYESCIIIVDDNMYYKSMRFSLYQVAQNEEVGFCQICLKCPLEDVIRYNSKRKNKVPSEIIIEMSKKIEMPNSENNWERNSLISNLNDVNLYENIFDLLENCLENPECKANEEDNKAEKELAAKITATNIVHQVDIVLRHVVGCKIKEYIKNDNGDLKIFSKELNKRKMEFLKSLEKKEEILPDDVVEEIQQVDVIKKTKLESYLMDRFS